MTPIPRRVWAAIGLLLIAVNVPYLVGYLNTPAGGAFTGNAFEQTRVDYNSHLAKIQLGLRGEWLYHLLFTPEEHPAALLQTFYTALGQIARLTGLSPVAAYHLARLAAMTLMWVIIWQFVARWLPDERERWWAFLLATVTGGLGWMLYLIVPAQAADLAPIEFWLLDAFTLLAALTFPHLCAAIAALLGFALTLDRWLAAPSWRGVSRLAILSLLLGLLQPFDLLLTALLTLTLVLIAFARRRLAFQHLFMLVPVALAHALVVAYDWAVFNSHPVWQAFAAQNLTLSPPPIYYLLAYFWLLIPASFGLASLWRAKDGRWLLPLVWVILVTLLLYAPLPTQRRFLMGVQVPLALLAASGLEHWRRGWLARGWPIARWRLLLTAGLSFSMLTHALFILSAVLMANPLQRPTLFLDGDTLATQAWLRGQPAESVIFSTFERGGEIPAFTGQRVYIGHWIETMDFAARQAQVKAFFAAEGMNDKERLALLQTVGADYVWYDRAAADEGVWEPEGVDWLRPAFTAGAVTIYEVEP